MQITMGNLVTTCGNHSFWNSVILSHDFRRPVTNICNIKVEMAFRLHFWFEFINFGINYFGSTLKNNSLFNFLYSNFNSWWDCSFTLRHIPSSFFPYFINVGQFCYAHIYINVRLALWPRRIGHWINGTSHFWQPAYALSNRSLACSSIFVLLLLFYWNTFDLAQERERGR